MCQLKAGLLIKDHVWELEQMTSWFVPKKTEGVYLFYLEEGELAFDSHLVVIED